MRALHVRCTFPLYLVWIGDGCHVKSPNTNMSMVLYNLHKKMMIKMVF